MNGPSPTTTAEQYLRRVEALLADSDEDERTSLLADLTVQLSEAPDSEVLAHLGHPEDFVMEYRRSAGHEVAPIRATDSPLGLLGTVVSAVALPLGTLLVFSFGGQVLFGPVVILEWLLARISPRPLRIAWSVLAGILAGEIVYIAVGEGLPAIAGGVWAILLGVVVGSVVGLVFNRTSRTPRLG